MVSPTVRGIAYMVAGSALLTLNDAVIKWLAASYPVGELMFVRGCIALAPIVAWAAHARGIAVLRVRSLRGQLLRATLVVAGTFLFTTSLRLMPLADAVALTFASPLIIIALARPLLGEVVGWRRWAAVIVGFMGVLVMVRPAGDAIRWVALLPLAAALMEALKDIATRRMIFDESSWSILAFTTLVVALGGLATLPLGWRPIALDDLALMGLGACFYASSQFLLIEAFRFIEAGLAAPFKYSSAVWAVLVGFVFWGDFPGSAILVGTMLVVASGIYIYLQELPQIRGK